MRNLTNADDKLTAVSGLASQIKSASLSEEEYMARLWRDSFVQDLSWYQAGGSLPSEEGGPGSSASEVEAPSWSWCLVNSQISKLPPPDGREEFGCATSGVAVLERPSLEIGVDSGDDDMLSSGLSFEASKDALVGFRQALCIKNNVCLEAVDPSHKAGTNTSACLWIQYSSASQPGGPSHRLVISYEATKSFPIRIGSVASIG